jgi:parallel beta-helix repeat protein
LGTRDNEVVGNIIENNIYGLGLHSVDNFGEYQYSHDNKIIINSIVANTLYGIELNSSSDNLICNNNFLGNTAQVYAENSTNEWDNGYPSGGNFWGDYTDTDTQRGLYQNETGSDGIWDHPYIIDANNQDHYPFTNPWHAAPIVSLSQTPDYPLPAQKVKIYANVTESSGASGVAIVFFSYRANGGPWWNTTMVFNCDLCLYETTIPDYEKHDFVEYFVKAVDNAGNTKTTLTYHYEVLRCDANHNGVVDVYDIYMIGKVWESSVGEPRYIFDADIDENGIINEQDLCLVNLQYGKDP